MISTTVTRRGMQVPRSHYFLTSPRTKPEALLRLIRQRWSIENEWHWLPGVNYVHRRPLCINHLLPVLIDAW